MYIEGRGPHQSLSHHWLARSVGQEADQFGPGVNQSVALLPPLVGYTNNKLTQDCACLPACLLPIMLALTTVRNVTVSYCACSAAQRQLHL